MKLLDLLRKHGNSQNKRKEFLDQVSRYIAANNLSTIPSILSKIMELNSDPTASTSDYAHVCEMDQSSCMRILSVANSVYYGSRTGRVVRTIEEAIVRLGVRKTQETINNAVVANLFKTNTPVEDYSSTALWMNSVAVAIGARAIADECEGRNFAGIDPYMVGLLHNIGITIEHQCFCNDGFTDAVMARSQNGSELIAEETQVLCINHAELGMEMARRWHFPETLAAALGHHHEEPGENADEDQNLVLAIRLSLGFAFEQELGYSDFGEQQLERYLAAADPLGLSPEQCDGIRNSMQQEMNRLKSMGWFSKLKLRHH